jgi:hypothetical protein
MLGENVWHLFKVQIELYTRSGGRLKSLATSGYFLATLRVGQREILVALGVSLASFRDCKQLGTDIIIGAICVAGWEAIGRSFVQWHLGGSFALTRSNRTHLLCGD